MVPILAKALIGNLLLLFLYLGCTTNQRRILFGHLLRCWLASLGSPSMFTGDSQFLPGMLKDQDTVDQKLL